MRKMFPLGLLFDRFWRGRLDLPPSFEGFRSAAELPHRMVRKVQLPGPKTPKSRFSHLPRVFARTALVVLPAVLLVTFISMRAFRHAVPERSPTQTSVLSANWQTSLDLSTKSLSQRPIFPYSIIPGGVRDAHELQNAATSDSVVARHYSDFRISQARTIQLNRPLAMYVSYRRKNQVYWTKNRMVIPAGESLIWDGENLARVRCANRLSAIAAKPVAASEPTTEELSEPTFVPPLLAQLLPGEGGEIFPRDPGALLAAGPLAGPVTTPNAPGLPVLPPILVPGVPPFFASIPVPPLPVSTPEPSSFWLLAAGAALTAVFAACSLRRNGSS
jgi:hypothetical protein